NSEPPVFTSSCENQILCFNLGCEAAVSFSATATDDKTAPENIFFTYVLKDTFGTIIRSGTGSTFGDTLSGGIYDLTWTAEDRCGNINTCSYQVQVKDCQAPSSICLSGITTTLM